MNCNKIVQYGKDLPSLVSNALNYLFPLQNYENGTRPICVIPLYTSKVML